QPSMLGRRMLPQLIDAPVGLRPHAAGNEHPDRMRPSAGGKASCGAGPRELWRHTGYTDPISTMTGMAREPVRFGLFDWIDESGRDLGDTYEERLRVLELADRAGFYGFHLAEHHATELSTVPSPNVFLSAVAQRTRRIRLGPLSYILPIYDPIRLMEEICMLDQLSGGRLELGLSRGSTGEHIEDDPNQARAMFEEALDIILMGLSTGEVDYPGKFFDYNHVVTRL